MLPPTIPTSFVPRSASASRRFRVDYADIFNLIAYGVLCIAFALAVGVFLYGRILASQQASKDDELAQAIHTMDPATVQDFVHLRDRLSSGKTLLANHTAFSHFFSTLGNLIPSTVRLASLRVATDEKGEIKFDGSGTAKSFNALAAASMAFAKDGRIKNAIFSNMAASTKDNSVSFNLSATLDPKLITFSP